MKAKHIYVLTFLLFISLFLSGCYNRGVLVIPADTHSHSTTVVTRYAPPPHAPAHGHRHRHYKNELRFDSNLGAYIVINTIAGLYFYNDHYIRFYNGDWQVTNRLENSWRSARQNDIPRKLINAKHNNKKRHDKHQKHDHRGNPEHGHRRHHQGRDFSFDERIGAYIILKQPGIYFHNEHYLRQHRGVWQTASALNGRWRKAKDNEVPRQLRSAKRIKKKKQYEKEQPKGRQKETWQEKVYGR